MKKDKQFLTLVIKGDNQIIEDLKKNKDLKNIKDEKGNNIVHYLIAGNQKEITQTLLKEKLINYTTFSRTINELLINQDYKKDNYYDFFMLLKDQDKEKIMIKNIENVIKNNNIKTYKEVEIKNMSKSKEMNNISFMIFVECGEEMLECAIDLYKTTKFNIMEIKEGFKKIKLNKIRTSILMENLNINMSPLLYEELNRVNEYCGTYLENRDLYNKLEKKLTIKEEKVLKKI